MPRSGTPRIGVLAPSGSEHPDSVREAGGEPVTVGLPEACPAGGVALRREWIADWAQVSSSSERIDALLVGAAEPSKVAGLLIAALRLDLPAVVATPSETPVAVSFAALGFAPLSGNAAEVAVEAARTGGPLPHELVQSFSLANALRVGLSLGAGPELLVHLAAVAREAGTIGFLQMIRVLAPESPKITDPGSSWFAEHGAAGLFAHLGDTLHDTKTVIGGLKEDLPPAPPAPEAAASAAGSHLVFVRGRASGTEIVCQVVGGATEISGSCRVYASEEEAVQAVGEGAIDPSDLLVVGGCGPRGGPGLLRLDRLGYALGEAGLGGAIPVLTDGLPPEGVPGAWASLATPEISAGVLGRLRDGDVLRLDLTEGLIRTGVKANELSLREPLAARIPSGFGYAARYARTALPALEGAGFG